MYERSRKNIFNVAVCILEIGRYSESLVLDAY